MPDSLAPALTDRIREIDGVAALQFVDREAARRELRQLIGADLLAGYDDVNPLPRSFILGFEISRLTVAGMNEIEQTLISFPEIEGVEYSRRWLQKAESTRSITSKVGIALGGLILLTALISSANNIRLMTRARDVGLKQMRLSGAGRIFLAFPFLLEGLIIGGLAAILGWVLIFYGQLEITVTQFELVFPSREAIVLYCAGAATLGIVSGYLGIRKLLR
jgi:cell division transport system permease protein